MHNEVHLHGKRMHACCVHTLNFLNSYAPQVEAATAIPDNCSESDGIRPQTVRGYYSRTAAWMESIRKLGDPADVQAITAAARALFEAQVDLVLLCHASVDHPAQKVFDWERSAVLKQMEKVERFFRGRPLPIEYQGIPAFLKGPEIPSIRAARARWWQGKHPRSGRWTGKALSEDAILADTLFPTAQLAEFYELEYSSTCWGTHGSGLAGLRSRDPILIAVTCASHSPT